MNDDPKRAEDPNLNGAILVECKALKNAASSAAESETSGIFYNDQKAIPMRHILAELGHQQLPTPIKTNNSTTTSFANNNIY